MQGARPECAQIVTAGRWTKDAASVKTNQMSSGLEPEFAISIHSFARARYKCHRRIGYWVGRMLCVKPIVLMARSMGVSGGSKLGVRKSVSNL